MREFLKKKKTLLILAAAIIAIAIAWSQGAVSTTEAIAALTLASAGMTAKAGANRSESLLELLTKEMKK